MDRFVRERDTMRLISAGQAINKTLKLPQMWKLERITIYATFSTVRPKPQSSKKIQNKMNSACVRLEHQIHTSKFHRNIVKCNLNREQKENKNTFKTTNKYAHQKSKTNTHTEKATECLIENNDCSWLHLFAVEFTIVIFAPKFVFWSDFVIVVWL